MRAHLLEIPQKSPNRNNSQIITKLIRGMQQQLIQKRKLKEISLKMIKWLVASWSLMSSWKNLLGESSCLRSSMSERIRKTQRK